MTPDQFTAWLDRQGSTVTRMDGKLIVEGRGYVDLDSLTTLPDNVTFSNGGSVFLASLTTLPDNVTFSNGGYVDLASLTTLPDNVTFSNGGYVFLDSLTALPDNVTFSNGGNVFLGNFTTEPQLYQGKPRRFRSIDGWTMLMGTSRKIGDVTLHTARYLKGGPVEKLPKCFIADQDGMFAHGNTADEALRDLRFKIAQADYDPAELIEGVKARGVITFDEFRLLTGACLSGLQHGLESLGLPPDTKSLPLGKALDLVRGHYGDAEMQRAFGERKAA